MTLDTTKPSDVVSLMFVKGDDILLGQRAFTRPRHPGVLSTITKRARVQPLFVGMLIQDIVNERLSNYDKMVATYKIHEPPLIKWVADPLGTDISEYTKMVTIEVNVLTDWNPKPNRRFYENVGWFPIELFKEAYTKRDAQMLLPNARPETLCIHGACVEGAMRVLNEERLD